jgi:hypothetical protein
MLQDANLQRRLLQTTFFTRIVRRGVLVASGGVTPTDGAVPATAMVIAVEEADSVPTSSCSVLGGEAEGLQLDFVSVQSY